MGKAGYASMPIAAGNEKCDTFWTEGPINMKFSGYMQINQPHTLKYKKPEVETEIQDGGGGHFGII